MNELKQIIEERISDASWALKNSDNKEYWQGVLEGYFTTLIIILIINTEQ